MASGGAGYVRGLRARGALRARRDAGYFGLTRAGQWNLCGRVASFANCSDFSLCERTPPSKRLGPEEYVFGPQSPAVLGLDGGFDTRAGERVDVRTQ